MNFLLVYFFQTEAIAERQTFVVGQLQLDSKNLNLLHIKQACFLSISFIFLIHKLLFFQTRCWHQSPLFIAYQIIN